jgi:hypothetical protein
MIPRLLGGYVNDVLITEEPLLVVYQILESHWQKYFGERFYISVGPSAPQITAHRPMTTISIKRCRLQRPMRRSGKSEKQSISVGIEIFADIGITPKNRVFLQITGPIIP